MDTTAVWANLSAIKMAEFLSVNKEVNMYNFNIVDMGIKPGPKRIAVSTGKPDRRQRDNKQIPGNTPSLKPHIHKKGD
jgi:hypothetical protein